MHLPGGLQNSHSFILSFGVVFIEDVYGLVLFYVERSDLKGQRSTQISSELIWVTVAGRQGECC